MRARRANLVVLLERGRLLVRRGTTGEGRTAPAGEGQWLSPPGGLLEGNDPRAIGEWLQEELGRHRLSASVLIVVVPRSELALRWLDLPRVDGASDAAADAELVSMARMQMVRHLPSDAGDSAIDVLRLDPGASAARARVLAAAMPARAIEWWRVLAKSAGLSLGAVVPRPICIAEALAWRLVDRNEPVLAMSLGVGTLELTIHQGPWLMLARSLDWPDSPASADFERLATEARRTLAAYSSEGAPAVSMVAAADDHAGLQAAAAACAMALSLPVLVDTNNRQAAVASSGADTALRWAPSTLDSGRGIDFVHPRRPAVGDVRRRTVLLASILAMIVIVGGGWALSMRMMSTLEGELAVLRKQRGELDAINTAMLMKDARARHVDSWTSQAAFGWLSHLRWLSDEMPDTTRATLEEFRGELKAPVVFQPKEGRYDAGTWRCGPAAAFTITGKVKGREVANALRERLVATQIYGVESMGVDLEDRFVFALSTGLAVPVPSAGPVPSEARPAPAPAAQTGSDGKLEASKGGGP